jgi:SAM-dependent methyltransferase
VSGSGVAASGDSRRDPRRERAHFEALFATRGTLNWAERTPAAHRRRERRSALLMQATGLDTGRGRLVLEVGCGTGEYTRTLAACTAARLISIDITPPALHCARETAPPNVEFLCANVESLPFGDRTFDAVVGNAVLHHLRLERAMPELARVLRPGGRLCFAEPNMLNPQVFMERNVPAIGRRLDNSPGETAFVRFRLRHQLEPLGFTAVSGRPFDFLHPLTPPSLIPAVERLGRVLERLPLVAEVAGSLLITAELPAGGPNGGRP